MSAVEVPLWSGRPRAAAIAGRVFHVRIVGLYFAAGTLLAWRAPEAAIRTFGLGAAALVLVAVLAWLTARTTRYELHADKLVLRFGIALPATLVIPFSVIARVQVRVHGDRTGDVALRLRDDQHIGYVKLWPHARPWRLVTPEPMLRCIADASVMGPRLCRMLEGGG